jgi:ABC-2 type transport system ATP-binding protein
MKTTSAAHAIEVRGLRKSYGSDEAVRGISFEVAHGEVFCLLGPNGAGKTTTTEILEGYRSATAGEVSVLGYDPARGQRGMRSRVGIVLQDCGIQRDLTVAELVSMFASYYPRPRRREEVLDLVGLTAEAGTRAGVLSGGQRRRLDLALALIGDPDLIFLDEPTTGFDPAARRHAWETVRSLTELDKTVFLTTHYMDEAQALADRVAIMRAGEIIAIGAPDELRGRNRRPAEIRFHIPPGYSLEDTPVPVAGARRVVDGDRVLVTTPEPLAVAHQLTGWALDRGVDLVGFSVAQPTLEDIYLELTGGASAAGSVNDPTTQEVVT